ncbi:hypothetical protein E2C01_070965 [Portunus trituberculatus]|uniref:Secreted protein n=1 Tax=Portunus trituberculatus TaxID=210409 RepID=A0A5B7I6R1_PORTR|nr:hypothetical protein [Portunus trituberculatus]
MRIDLALWIITLWPPSWRQQLRVAGTGTRQSAEWSTGAAGLVQQPPGGQAGPHLRGPFLLMGRPQHKRLGLMFRLLLCSSAFFYDVLQFLGHLMVDGGHFIHI